ncbi:MAG: hypothetical protein OER88_01665, partial [Planctomycetota bacterium]|nr:hypothetical protein [Planctomycetota bacterium]
MPRTALVAVVLGALAVWLGLRWFAGESEGEPTPNGAPERTSHERMVAALAAVRDATADDNPWLGDKKARDLRPVVAALPATGLTREQWWTVFQLGVEELRLGNEETAVDLLARVVQTIDDVTPAVAPRWRNIVTYRLGVAYVRLAETQNCCRLS